MLRLNRLTDYAILVLGALAHRRGDVMPTARLAELTGLNQPTVAKVAKRLQSAGLLETRRGEFSHWIQWILITGFIAWNPFPANLVIIAYAFASNVPCLLNLRHTRQRLLPALIKQL